MLSTCSKGRYKLSHWGRNEAIRHNCDDFLMRLFVLGQQVTLVLSQTQERDGKRSRNEERREVEQELELAVGQQATEKELNYASYLVHLLKEHF